MDMNQQDFMALVNKIDSKKLAFIDGEYVTAKNGETYEKISPIDGSVIGPVTLCRQADVDAAVCSAKKAFETGVWSDLDRKERKDILVRFSELIRKNLKELAVLETLDMGKPISDSLGEMNRCVDGIRWFAEAIDKVYGDVAPTKRSVNAQIVKQPLGVVGAIVPWNYPLMMAVWKMAPALATGNSVVLKPAEQSPLTALYLGKLSKDAGIPCGVLNIVPGDGDTGKMLALHHEVDKIAFTGSTDVGKLILQYSGQSNMKRVSLECGGKSPNIVFADATDLDLIAKQSAGGMFYNSGQVCDAPTRLFVEKKIKDKFLEKIVQYSSSYFPGHPFDPETTMGSMVSKEQADRVMDYIETGKREGARLVLGGNRAKTVSGGYYIEPAIFDNVRNDMVIAQEEIFGPVLSVIEFDDMESVIEMANDSIYGLCAFVWTTSLNTAMTMSQRLNCGKVLINSTSDGDWSVPHGGFKQSGFGRDKSIESMDQYLQSKLVWIEY